MELIDCKALQPEVISLRLLDPTAVPPMNWRTRAEAVLMEDNGQIFLLQNNHMAPVEFLDRSHNERFTAGLWLWCLLAVHGDQLLLRGLSCRSALPLDLDIGVPDRIVEQLVASRRISVANPAMASAWLGEHLLLPHQEPWMGVRALALSNRSDRLTLIGARHEVDLSQHEHCWRIERLAPARANRDEPILLHGRIQMVDQSVAATLQSPAHRQQLQDFLDSNGSYIDLWQRYATREWIGATKAGRELRVLHYRAVKPTGREGLHWAYQVDSDDAREFLQRWRDITGRGGHDDAMLEACAEPPAWLIDPGSTQAGHGDRPVLGTNPHLVGDWLTLTYDQEHDVRQPPTMGLLCLSVHGERKVQQRREQALKRIRSGENPMRQLHWLLEGRPVPVSEAWRRIPALTPAARALFHSEPTPSQRKALDLALNTPDIALIIGPPGTGKTQVIAALQRRLTQLLPERPVRSQILISSFQHDAVDNALSRVSVLGLPPERIGGPRRKTDLVGGDHYQIWAEQRYREIRPRLEAALVDQPLFGEFEAVRAAAIRLRIQPLTPSERALVARTLHEGLRRLAEVHGIRPPATCEARWRDWYETQIATDDLTQEQRRRWRKTVWALRLTPESWGDDGPRQCALLLVLAERLALPQQMLLSPAQREQLADLATIPIATPNQLAALANLRADLLRASRTDLRPAVIRNALDGEGCRVLDELLDGLSADLNRRPELAALRVIENYLDDLRLNPQRVANAVRAYTTVLGASCQQAASEPMRGTLGLAPDDGIVFDTVIIEEAARATPLDLLIPMSMGRRRIILVGDHRQLPHLLDPVTENELMDAGQLSELERKGLSESLFERLVKGLRQLHLEHSGQPVRVVSLDTQFRMHPVLGTFVSRVFYEAYGEPPIASGRPAADFVHDVPGFAGRVCGWLHCAVKGPADRDGRVGSSRVREVEAKRIAGAAQRILRDCPTLSLGIITFYAAQRDLILKTMADHDLTEQRDSAWQIRDEWARDIEGAERLRVGTVDAFQGKEFDVVLLSIVRTNEPLGNGDREQALTRKYGFLRLSNRLNVAMSRQRRLLLVVGDAALARAPETATAAPGLAAFIALCEGEHGRVL